MTASPGLRREVGLAGLTAIAVNGVIGSGIFVLPATVAGLLGPASPLAYLVAAFVTSMVVLCFAEAGSRFDETGGPYLYAREAFGGLAGFMVGWMLLRLAADRCQRVRRLLRRLLAPGGLAEAHGRHQPRRPGPGRGQPRGRATDRAPSTSSRWRSSCRCSCSSASDCPAQAPLELFDLPTRAGSSRQPALIFAFGGFEYFVPAGKPAIHGATCPSRCSSRSPSRLCSTC